MLTGIILDLDGLLMDSEHWSWQAHNEALATFGHAPLSLAEVRRLVGLAGPEEWSALGFMRSLSSAHATYDALHRDAFSRIRARFIAPMSGVLALLTTARRAGLHIGLASNSGMPSILSALDGLAIAAYFDAVASGAEVRHGKPAPDVYLRVLELLKVRADDALAVEDSQVGIEAATAAGLRCLAVPNEITAAQDFTKAHLIFDNLLDAEVWLRDQTSLNGHAP